MKEELKRMKEALVVVDMVKGFREIGNMAVKDVSHIDTEIVKLIKMFLENGDDVISIQEGHSKDSVEFKDFPEHCILGTSEAELIDMIKEFEDSMMVIRKNSTCGFVTDDFRKYLLENMDNLRRIVFVGLCLDICVMNIAIPTKMFMNEHDKSCEVMVPMNATETYDGEGHSRDEYKGIARKLLKLNGIKVVDKYEREGR